ncbi:hypothetical protein QYF61_027736 [Mycteria americana]|uniref:Uncharacterized protein n=1 Tax=Mycteria americana TaxID=33587 RepID=A0AAN7S5P0_MYCAM|nr:hypothetical protein QYF61_027736 [Mycteria americana]
MATAGRRAPGGGEREREQDVRDVGSALEDARFRVLPDLTMYGQRSHRVDLRKGLATARETPRDHPPPPAPVQKIENFLEQEPLALLVAAQKYKCTVKRAEREASESLQDLVKSLQAELEAERKKRV